MHLSREQILKIFFKKMCAIRPTLVFGASDPITVMDQINFETFKQAKISNYL